MAPESGSEYLARLAQQYDLAQRSLPRLPDDEFDKVRRESLRKELGIESFLMDFAIGAEERRRNIERWATGRSITPASAEHATAIISALPSYTIANPEAVGAMRVEHARHFRLDIVSEDILAEIARRLPRTIDTYRYHQDYAHDTLNIPGLGEVKVTMTQTGNGIFTTIGSVESETFKIWNCRKSGVKYIDRYNDISRPNTVTIRDSRRRLPQNAQTLNIDLYDDESGTFVELDGKRFTNARWQTAEGSGYSTDWQRDDLHRTYSGNNDMNPHYQEVNKGWRNDKTVLSWKEVEDNAIVWLAENVLNPLKESPEPETQATTPPEEEPFPEGKVDGLFTFVRMEDVERIRLIKDNPQKAYPEERKAIQPSTRLVNLGIPLRDAPQIAHDGYIWCGVGTSYLDTNMDNLTIGWETRRRDRMFGSNEALAVIKPKTATDVFIVDWQVLLDYREQVFEKAEKQKRDRMTDEEYGEMYRAVARTLIPITEYEGNYGNPVVLIGRDLELDEVDTIYLPPEEEKD